MPGPSTRDTFAGVFVIPAIATVISTVIGWFDAVVSGRAAACRLPARSRRSTLRSGTCQ